MWAIETTDIFDEWFDVLDDADKINVLASLIVLREKGPALTRPYADTVKGSHYTNMKELRVQSKGKPLRLFFAFGAWRRGIILCGGNKSGNEKHFYNVMIPMADREFYKYLQQAERI